MRSREEYVDGSAYGEAPHGPAPQGQPAGERYPGNPRMQIDRGNPNPSDRAMRIDALYATIERNDIKSEAGERMMHHVNGKRTESITPEMRRKVSPGEYE
jgi:hypothetical protein